MVHCNSCTPRAAPARQSFAPPTRGCPPNAASAGHTLPSPHARPTDSPSPIRLAIAGAAVAVLAQRSPERDLASAAWRDTPRVGPRRHFRRVHDLAASNPVRGRLLGRVHVLAHRPAKWPGVRRCSCGTTRKSAAPSEGAPAERGAHLCSGSAALCCCARAAQSARDLKTSDAAENTVECMSSMRLARGDPASGEEWPREEPLVEGAKE